MSKNKLLGVKKVIFAQVLNLDMLIKIQDEIKDNPDDEFPFLTVDFGRHMLQAKYEWLTNAIKKIGEEK